MKVIFSYVVARCVSVCQNYVFRLDWVMTQRKSVSCEAVCGRLVFCLKLCLRPVLGHVLSIYLRRCCFTHQDNNFLLEAFICCWFTVCHVSCAAGLEITSTWKQHESLAAPSGCKRYEQINNSVFCNVILICVITVLLISTRTSTSQIACKAEWRGRTKRQITQ